MPHDPIDIILAQDRVLHDMGCPKPAVSKQWLREYFVAMTRALEQRPPADGADGRTDDKPEREN